MKAEISRKHQELAKARNENDRKIKVIKKNTPLEFKNKTFQKDKQKGITEIISENEEDQDLLRTSRSVEMTNCNYLFLR